MAELNGRARLGYHRPMRSSWLVLSVTVLLAACGPSAGGGDDDGDGGGDGGVNPCPGGCPEGKVCVPDLGCRTCFPNQPTCVANDVWTCGPDGEPGAFDHACAPDEECQGGVCVTACARAAADRSNVGCEYWPVDLDNEYSQFNDAAAEQFAIALANTSSFTVDVVVEQNNAPVGMPPQLSTVTTRQIPPSSLVVIDLPRREVDGSLAGMNEGPGTMLSSRAYRVRTSYPVVAYQFNPIVQSFSNGASLLIPTSGLDDRYWVLGWPTANPIAGPFPIPGIPDHSFVTIVGVTEAPVRVEVILGGPIVGGGGIPATPKGGMVTADLRAFDVLNLESDGIPGDLTGTLVIANGPVAVYSGGERAIVPIDVEPPPPPGYDPSMLCCTEHFEQQMFPTTALGKAFVTTRSPPRSRNKANPEGDVWRVLGTEPGTVVTTNLPPPFHMFTVDTGKYFEFWSQQDFVLEASAPVIVGQYLVSQGYVENPEVGGDPEFIVFPPYEQFRKDYIFLVPPTFQKDYCVIAAPDGAQVLLDGANVSGELDPLCEKYPAGLIGGQMYVAIRCPLVDGVHRVQADMPVGVTVYGYYNVGSYGYPAGAELKRINIE